MLQAKKATRKYAKKWSQKKTCGNRFVSSRVHALKAYNLNIIMICCRWKIVVLPATNHRLWMLDHIVFLHVSYCCAFYLCSFFYSPYYILFSYVSHFFSLTRKIEKNGSLSVGVMCMCIAMCVHVHDIMINECYVRL